METTNSICLIAGDLDARRDGWDISLIMIFSTETIFCCLLIKICCFHNKKYHSILFLLLDWLNR